MDRKDEPGCTCSYYIKRELGHLFYLGTVTTSEKEDFDDAFPKFFSQHFSGDDYYRLWQEIKSGSVLIAVSEKDQSQSFLAYVLDEDPETWYGRQATLEYFEIEFKHAS
jgi:hypothetical protein